MLPIDLGAYVLGAKSSMASHALQIIGKHHPWSHERDMKEILFKLSRPLRRFAMHLWCFQGLGDVAV
jgi:hypothetical protein